MNNTIVGSVNPSFKEYGDSLVTLIKSNQESIDLADHLRDSDSEVYAKDNQHVFSKIATTQFPESLQVEGLDPQYKMGFLPSIKQVWLATSTSLYIWNYVDNTEVFKYENTEAIENAEMLTFRHHQELVVSTAHHIFVHSIQKDDNNKLKIVSNACVKTDSVIMSEFVVTDKQRVFMRGSDGHLYELNYKTGVNHYISSGTLICHTENPIVKYFSFLRYVPKASVKSLVVDNDQEFLYYLLNDSSIHSVDIGGSVYLPNQRFNGAQLESLHLIPKSESTKVNLMAISNKGERLYFSCKDKKIDLIYTRTSPPLPGSLLFNDLTKETCDLSFYNHGVFAAVLGKSKRSYLVMTNANSIPDENGLPLMVEDVYNESVDKKIWSIIESNPKDTSTHHYFKETTESPESPARRFSTLTDAGITHYIKQRPVDYLSEAVASDAPIKRIAFLNRYGPIETSAMTLLLACSSHQSPRVFQFLQTLHNMNEGLLLYFSRIVGNIWTTDILKETIRQDQFISTRENLGKLIACIEETNMDVKDDIVNLIKRTMEAIKFVCFMHSSGWEKIRQSLPTTCKLFGDMVTTEEGALLAKEMVFAAIKTTELSNNLNDYNHVSNFLKVNCNNFLGNINTVYYQGMECLQAACNDTNNGASLRFSLDHFKKIINFIELDTLQTLCQEYGRLGYHIGAIELAYSKYENEYSPSQEIFDILFGIFENAFSRDDIYGQTMIEKALQSSKEEGYHYKIYQWLMESGRKNLLVTMDTPLLVRYIETELSPSESLACLHSYYDYRKIYGQAVDCLIQLATRVPDIPLESRVACLDKACKYLQQPTDVPKEAQESLELIHMESKIQLNIYNALIDTEYAKDLATSLKPASTLLREFAYTHALYEEALCLMDLMEHYNWKYVREAWKHIIVHNEEHLNSKINEMSKRLYPSLTSFPVYIIYTILDTLHSRHSKDLPKKLLLEAGVPQEVIADAKHFLSLKQK